MHTYLLSVVCMASSRLSYAPCGTWTLCTMIPEPYRFHNDRWSNSSLLCHCFVWNPVSPPRQNVLLFLGGIRHDEKVVRSAVGHQLRSRQGIVVIVVAVSILLVDNTGIHGCILERSKVFSLQIGRRVHLATVISRLCQ